MIITEVSAILSSLKAAKDIAESLIGLSNAETVRTKVGEIKGKFLDAQDAIFAVNQERAALIDRVSELEQQIRQLEDWNIEKQKYELEDLGVGSFAYRSIACADALEPPHRLCARCYQDAKKSILQSILPQVYAGFYTLRCSRCGSEVPCQRRDLPAKPKRTFSNPNLR